MKEKHSTGRFVPFLTGKKEYTVNAAFLLTNLGVVVVKKTSVSHLANERVFCTITQFYL